MKKFVQKSAAAAAGKRKFTGKKSGKKNNNKRPNHSAKTEKDKETHEAPVLNLDINKDAGEFFRTNASFDQHYEAQNQNRDLYVSTLMAFDHYSIEVIANARARSLAASFARHDKELTTYLLSHNKNYGFVDVLKAVNILDSAREKRSIEKKIERIQTKTKSVIGPKKLGQMRNDVNNLERMKPCVGSFSGAMQRLIKKYVSSFSNKDFEFFALSFPTEPWKKLANLAHLNPTKDFPQAPWFLPFCFGEENVANEKITQCRQINAENVNELLSKYDLPYSTVKKYVKDLNETSKKILAKRQEKLDTILWYYEELACGGVDSVIRARLEKNEKVELGYGKLMERLLMFKERKNDQNNSSIYELIITKAESELINFKSALPEPVAILGDASSSMDVAIRTATIISSLLTAICKAKLSFFNSADFEPSILPKNVAEVIELARTTKASGSTANAASLLP